MSRAAFTIFILLIYNHNIFSQANNPQLHYEAFKNASAAKYSSFRGECNSRYAEFLKSVWGWYEGKSALPMPKEETPIPPKPYKDEDRVAPVSVTPAPVLPVENTPQPKPIEPVKENPEPQEDYFAVKFYGISPSIRLSDKYRTIVNECSAEAIAYAWQTLSEDGLNNTIRDCLETRIRYGLSDWAYLQFLHALSTQFCGDANSATFLMAYLYCQSGYQMRFAIDSKNLRMLYSSRHQIFNQGYFTIDGMAFYTFGDSSDRIKICNASFEGESPLSLCFVSEQKIGGNLTNDRIISSKEYADVSTHSRVPVGLIELFDSYPASTINNNPMTRWAMYANVPLAERTRETLYPSLRQSIKGDDIITAANKLLNWVQTGFEYEYDDKVWGHDRAFFAEETLYYPYCDCEDRSILFSRLVRDLLGLDVALIYYPGHLATAVCFDEDVQGDAMMINGRRFIVCDPTYIGAPVGAQMPDLDYAKAKAIVLER